MTEHEIGFLREYMDDLVEQAGQESKILQIAGYREKPYSPEEALMDLLVILDDRFESEGLEVGISETFLHQMWKICKNSEGDVKNHAWLEATIDEIPFNKKQIRRLSYNALLRHIETSLP